MEENKNTARLFHVEIAQGIYLISDPEQGPTEDGNLWHREMRLRILI